MFERIKRLYDTGKLSENGVRNASDKGWITEAEYAQIVGVEDEDMQNPAE